MILNGLRIGQLVIFLSDRASLHPRQLLVRIHSDDLALILIHQHLPVLRLVHLLRIVFEREVHHDLSVKVAGINQVIHVQALAVIEGAHRVPEHKSIYKNLPIYLPSSSQVVQRRALYKVA